MPVVPNDPYQTLTESQCALYDRVVRVAAQADLSPVLVLYGGFGEPVPLADLAAIEQALTSRPLAVSQPRDRTVRWTCLDPPGCHDRLASTGGFLVYGRWRGERLDGAQ